MKSKQWYIETAKKVYQPKVYLAAAKLLLDEGKITESDVPWKTDGFKPVTKEFIDGLEYDGKEPIKYLNSHKIGNKDPE